MADFPDIIIRTAEELWAEKAFQWGLAEGRHASGLIRMHFGTNIRAGDYIEMRTWRFKTEESRLVFAAARILELRRDGVAIIHAHYTPIYNECPDRRLSPDSYDNPNRKRERIPRSAPLEW